MKLGVATAGGTMLLRPRAAHAETFFGIGNDKLPGALATKEDIDRLISKLNKKLSQISLANDQALQEECQAIVLGMQRSVDGARAALNIDCLLYTSPSPRDQRGSRMPSSA